MTRVSTDQDVGEQMVGQLFSNPRVMLLAAAVLGLLGLVPGMPNLVFLLLPPPYLVWRGGYAGVNNKRQRSRSR
ncbi:flagellar biosynthesis protein FlhA [Salmonella bongori]|nr:flagellar biosynthesis protein FlhA [Salmonella bongori]